MLKSIKIVSTGMVLLVIFLQLGLSTPLHAMYDQSVIGKRISDAQQHNQPVAISSEKLAHQFQFAGRLKTPLVPQPGLAKITAWAGAHKDGLCLIYTKSTHYKQLMGNGDAVRYDDGWLIFRPAKDFPGGS